MNVMTRIPSDVVKTQCRSGFEALVLEIRMLRGEHIDVADETADAVVATLVLCSVDDPHKRLRR